MMEFEEFKKLLTQIKVFIKEQDLAKVFKLMDLSEKGKISYNDFCDVIEKDKTLPIERVVRQRRVERGDAVDDDKILKPDISGLSQFKTAFGEASGT